MAFYKRDSLHTILSRSTSNAPPSFELLTALKPSPEPNTTFSGTSRGCALYDTPPPNTQELEQLESCQRSQRLRSSTERGALYTESRDKSRERSVKIHRTKQRKAKSRATTLDTNCSCEETDGHQSVPTSGSNSKDMPKVPNNNHAPAHRRNDTSAPNTGQHAATAADAAEGRIGTSNATNSALGPGISRCPTPTAGTPGTQPEYTYLIESLDPAELAAHVAKFVDYDCSNLSNSDLKALLHAFIEDRTPSVESPKRKAEILLLSPSPLNVGGGNHLDRMEIDRTEPSHSKNQSRVRSTKIAPKRQKKNYQDNIGSEAEPNNEFEPEPELDIDTEPEIDTDRESVDLPSFYPNRPPLSPSPIPMSPTQNDLKVIESSRYVLRYPPGLPESLGTTQDSTQARSTRSSISTAENTSDQRRSTQSASRSQPLKRWESTSSVSLGAPPRTRTRPQSRSAAPSTRNVSQSTLTQKLPNPSRTNNKPSKPPVLGNLRAQDNHSPSQILHQMHTRAKGSAQVLKQQHQHQTRPTPRSAQASQSTTPIFEVIVERGHKRKYAEETTSRQHRLDEQLEEDLVPDNEEECQATAAQAEGHARNGGRKRKPTSRDVHGYDRQILNTAKLHLFAVILVEGPYQTRAALMNLAAEVFEETWQQELPHVPFRAPPIAVLQIMVNSVATNRGKVKEALRTIVEYQYEFTKPAITDKIVNRNLQIFQSIHPNTFHCIGYSPIYGHYESNILLQAIAAALFGSPSAVGIIFSDYFDPMPLTTVAFILANMQFCIEEWETGHFHPHDLSTSEMLNKYVAHLRGIKEARAAARTRISRMQKEWFDYGREYSGAVVDNDPLHQPITLRNEVRPDTPTSKHEKDTASDAYEATPSEPDPYETNKDGSYTARAKGKSRAD